MFIQTEETPNPNTMKFLPGEPVLGDDTAFFINAEEAKSSPLAAALFDIANIRAVFFGADFVTVTKADPADWSVLKPMILTTIMDHYVAGKPIMGNAAKSKSAIVYSDDEQKIVNEIVELIDSRVRPSVAQDGGDIIFHSFQDGVVHLELHGSCSGCPSSTITLKQGIENMLKHYIPEVRAVEAVA